VWALSFRLLYLKNGRRGERKKRRIEETRCFSLSIAQLGRGGQGMEAPWLRGYCLNSKEKKGKRRLTKGGGEMD